MGRTLYEVLDVSPSATSDELRQAYRERARVLHPDRRASVEGGDPSLVGTPMQEVNDAWRVLRDPVARAAYDRSITPHRASLSGERTVFDDVDDLDDLDDLDRPFRGRPAEPGDLVVALVRALPWLVVGVILGAIFVFTAFAGGGGDPSSRQMVGDCVRASSALVEVVPCTGPEDSQVVAVTPEAADCPVRSTPTAAGRDRVLCLRPFAGASP